MLASPKPAINSYPYPDTLNVPEDRYDAVMKTLEKSRETLYPSLDKHHVAWRKLSREKRCEITGVVDQRACQLVRKYRFPVFGFYENYISQLVAVLLERLPLRCAHIAWAEQVSPTLTGTNELLATIRATVYLRARIKTSLTFQQMFGNEYSCPNPYVPKSTQIMALRNIIFYMLPRSSKEERLAYATRIDQYYKTIQDIRGGTISAYRRKIKQFLNSIDEKIQLTDAKLYVLVASIFFQLLEDRALAMRINFQTGQQLIIYFSAASIWRHLAQEFIEPPQEEHDSSTEQTPNSDWLTAEYQTFIMLLSLREHSELCLPSLIPIVHSPVITQAGYGETTI